MWWRNGLLAAGTLLALSACGFRPMYGRYSADPAVNLQLAGVTVDPIAERAGQLLHNALLTELNPRGEPAKPVYHLQVILTYSDNPLATSREDDATRNVVAYTAIYKLFKDRVVIAQGIDTSNVSYDFLVEHYADITAESDIQKRSAKLLAQEIRNDLAAYFIRAGKVNSGQLPPVP